jgi:ferredoxin
MSHALIVISARSAVLPDAGLVEKRETGANVPRDDAHSLKQDSPMGNIENGRHKEKLKRIPVIDLSLCTDCDSCLVVAPTIFQRNPETGFIEVMDLNHYPEEEIDRAISVCPADCIVWEQTV